MRADRGLHQVLYRQLPFRTALVGLLFALALAAVPTTGFSQSELAPVELAPRPYTPPTISAPAGETAPAAPPAAPAPTAPPAAPAPAMPDVAPAAPAAGTDAAADAVAPGAPAPAAGRPYRTFDETVGFINSKLSQVDRNKRLGYRLTVSTICVAYWGNNSIRTELMFSLLNRTGVNTGSDSSVICPPVRNSRSRAQACIPVQFRSRSGWSTLKQSQFARFPAGSDADSAEVQDALNYLMEMCGRR